jgi:multicomponent K+:H+ antiporter subunit A
MSIAFVALVPLLGALIPGLLGRCGRNVCAASAAAISIAASIALSFHVAPIFSGATAGSHAAWIPQFGLSFSFFVDGLSLFFAGLILAIGLLIILYARSYMSATDPIGRFYAYLLLFQGSMLGIVLSDNVILLLVFWEMTSLSSFLLIGYEHHRADSRQGARMALIVTGGGGLALIAGMLMLAETAGSYELSEIIRRGEQVRSAPLYIPALILILIGAFTKSAQFPFHFWLPHAMAAPTPVSAYLHSATMVKAGIFLLARLWPVFAGTDIWFLTVSLTGLVTMLIAAWIALFKDDLKLLLAFSTVSHLGLITMLLGIGSPMAVVTAIFHILNHATFKAALFMSAGIVQHEAGTRKIKDLRGFARLMPITATLILIATASMAGVPLLNGFVSKEMMLEQASTTVYAGQAWLFPVLCTVGALISVAYSARLAAAVFFGNPRYASAHVPHDPPLAMSFPVMLLIVPVIAFGILPGLAQPTVSMAASAVTGGPLPEFHLAVWHGFTQPLAMSAMALLGGGLLWLAYRPLELIHHKVARPDAKRMFEISIRESVAAARAGIDFLHTRDLQRYALIIVVTVLGLGLFGFLSATHAPGSRELLDVNSPAMVAWFTLLAVCAITLLRHRDRLLMLIVTGVAGLVVSLVFLQFSAPDLALTQISVEVVTTILLLLALNLLPKTTPAESSARRKFVHGATAVGVGAGTMVLVYSILTRGFESISEYHLAQAKPAGGGTNVVNVILVDFRAYDTFGEIIVLGIAGIVIYALLEAALNGKRGRRQVEAASSVRYGEAHPLILVSATRVLLPLALTVGIYIFLRGHNLPGGGFIAGIVVAIAFIMQYIASGYEWAHERSRLDPQLMISGGVALGGVTGLASWAFGYPLLTSTFGYVELPVLGSIELTSVIAFDLGVFLVVVGTVMLALASISRVEADANNAAVVDRSSEASQLPLRPVSTSSRQEKEAV